MKYFLQNIEIAKCQKIFLNKQILNYNNNTFKHKNKKTQILKTLHQMMKCKIIQILLILNDNNKIMMTLQTTLIKHLKNLVDLADIRKRYFSFNFHQWSWVVLDFTLWGFMNYNQNMSADKGLVIGVHVIIMIFARNQKDLHNQNFILKGKFQSTELLKIQLNL